MDETGGAFRLDTKGICLMCLRDCNLYDYFGPPKNRVKQGIGTRTRSISFKMLLRYLKINLFQLCNFPPGFLESMDAGEDTDVVISLCEGCSVLTQSFSRLYESMEEIRMQLDACLQTVFEVMKEGDGQEDRVEEYRRRRRSKNMLEMMTANVADQLRNETIRKCSLKVDALVPRVTMYKREMTSLKGFLGPSSSFQNNGKPPGPKCKLGQNDNFHLKQLLEKPQNKAKFYPDSGTLLNTLANQQGQGQQRAVATKKSRSRRRMKNEPIYEEVPETAPSSEEMVVKVEPLIFAQAQQFHNEYDPLDELEGEMGPFEGDEVGGQQQPQNNGVGDATTSTATPSPPAFYQCPECPRKYVKHSLLCKHQLVFHKTKKNRKPPPNLKGKKRRLRCKFCPRLFANKANLVLHMKAHPQNTIPLLANGIKSPVKKTRKSRKEAGGRGRGRLTQPTGTIRCQYCEKWFSSHGVFQTHMVAIHSLHVYKKHLPEGTTEEQLNSVIKSAFDEYIQYPRDHTKKQYGCPYCPQRYPHPSHLRLHIIRGHFDRIAKKIFDDRGMTNEAPEGHNYEEGMMAGEGFEIEFENGSMDMEGDDSSEMFHVEYDYENGNENEDDGGGEGDDSVESGDQVMIMGEGEADHNGEEGAMEEEEEDGDYDDQPPILMRETYSLTERETVIPDQDAHEDDEAVDSIPIPIVRPAANF